MTRTSEHTAIERGPKSLTQRQTVLVILRAAERAVAVGGTGHGCRRDHPRARTGRAAPSRTALRSVGTSLDILVPFGSPTAARRRGQASQLLVWSFAMTALAPTMEAFFTERL